MEATIIRARDTDGNPHLPGEAGIWILVIGDLFVFALFFGTVAYYRIGQVALFSASQAMLEQGFGLANTLLLLTSSLCVAKAVEAMRAGAHTTASRLVGAAMAMGAGFVAIKATEYAHKLGAGVLPTTNDFFMLYFVFTGIHLVHVIAGLVLLSLMRGWVGKADGNSALAECGAIFWHLVDVLWIILFAIFYLHR